MSSRPWSTRRVLHPSKKTCSSGTPDAGTQTVEFQIHGCEYPMRFFIVAVLATLGGSNVFGGETPLYQLACRYEAEVDAMEKIVKCTRGVDRADERLLDRLDDEIGRLRLAAKNPRHFNRLANQWTRVAKLARQTESTLFGKYTPNHDWLGQWDRVMLAESLFVEEFVLEVENPDHVNSVRRVDRPSARRESYLRPLSTLQPEPFGASANR